MSSVKEQADPKNLLFLLLLVTEKVSTQCNPVYFTRYSCSKRNMRKSDLFLPTREQVFLLCHFVPHLVGGVWYFCSWERHLLTSPVSLRCCSGIPSAQRCGSAPAAAATAGELPPATLLQSPCWGNHASPFSEMNLCCCEGNSGVKLRCNAGIKSFTQSRFLTRLSIHYCLDISLDFLISIFSLLQFSASFEREKFFSVFRHMRRREREGKGNEGKSKGKEPLTLPPLPLPQ